MKESRGPVETGSEPVIESITLSNRALEFSAYACGLRENAAAPLVLCLHGFPDNARSFRFQLPALARAGYRAIAATLRGYEPSSQPLDGDYSLATLARDVLAWMDGLGEAKIHLVGHDWGAAITYTAGAIAPDRFHSLTTIAVPHAPRLPEGIRAVPSQLSKSWYMMFFQLPAIAEWAVERDDWAELVAGLQPARGGMVESPCDIRRARREARDARLLPTERVPPHAARNEADRGHVPGDRTRADPRHHR